ncbi:oligosaccharide flippase family protein [Frigidibacter oleivorans]|uniref:oligosaccharide flippase family protein n=1 Tax=Frigidibacter oleivorans TaxID=2487129 RepID=UPI0013DFDA1F|nr:oligosaccharide flippase family protein [Frigidibacter oleivorans]
MSVIHRLTALLPAFVRKTLASFLLRFTGLGLQFVGAIAISRAIGVEGFGAYTYAFTWVTLIGTVLGLGFGQLAGRELPVYVAQGQHGALRGYLVAGPAAILATGIVAAIVLAVLQRAGLFNLTVGWLLVSLGAMLHAAILNTSSILAGFQQVLKAQVLESLLRPLIFLGLLLAVWASGWALSANLVFSISLLAMLPLLALSLRAMGRAAREALPPDAEPRRYLLAAWFAASLPMLASSLSTFMQTNIDVILLGMIDGDVAVGQYRAASRAADLTLIANGIALQVLGPMLSRALASGDRAGSQRMISQSAMISGAVGMAICLTFGLGAELYLSLYGEAFRPAADALRLLMLAQAVSILCGPVGVILIMMRRERTVLALNLASLVANFVLNLLLIPRFGLTGAAFATMLAVAGVRLAQLWVVLRVSGFDPTVWTPLRRRFGRGRG